jgi:two-component system, NarL family, response regulator NreC
MAITDSLIRVAIADDQIIFREGITKLIESMHGLKLVYAAENGKELLQEIRNCSPEVVLLDYRMPGMNGIEATKAIRASYPDIKILILSLYDDQEFVEAALENGANGYLSKDDKASEIEIAINSVYNTGYYLNDRTSKILIARMMEQGKVNPEFKTSKEELTAGELEVLKLICQEKTTQEIADLIHRSQRTVDGLRMSMMSKIGARNAVGLVMYAIKKGIVIIS